MKTGGMTRSKKRLIDVIVSILKKQKRVIRIEIEKSAIRSFIPARKRKADILVILDDTSELIIQCINQEGSGTACYKFENYKKERDFDIVNGINSVIVCSGVGQPEAYLRYMLCQGVIFSEWFETWLNIYLSKSNEK